MTDTFDTSDKISRRSLLKGMAASASLALTGCGRIPPAIPLAAPFVPGQPLPWINWAKNHSCYPTTRLIPHNEAQLVEQLNNAKGTIRAVGSSHAFSALVPTKDTLLTTDYLSGLIRHDKLTSQAEVWAGTRLHRLGPELEQVGLATQNLPDMDYPSLAGAIATSTHGTGKQFGSLSTQVTGLTLATVDGRLLNISADKDPELFSAARNHLGALGILTRVRLQCQPAYNLTEVSRVEPLEQMLDELEKRMALNRHFELFALPYSPLGISVTTNEAAPGDVNQGEEDADALNQLRQVFESVAWIPGVGEPLYAWLLEKAFAGNTPVVRTGASYKVLAHSRTTRFREMEYSVPVAAGPACLRKVLKTIKDAKIPACFPIEYRHVKGDDIMLSMYQGRDSAVLSVHQFGDLDYRPFFNMIEPIFHEFDGRPHWGKIHSLDASQLARLYPAHWQDFQAVRESLDPQGRLINPHLHKILGV
ncbi:D-arabinono-1,4-lactone oxidase [Lacimicrobium alkaliphilum]|uniref:Oxidoreductase n=1 Tax=Lacimicrobium alkaliphilum TaxID=1526571 RepID=A0ABQ1RRH2_9ALTE|nr:D-arabinono-1,4-lactone oxidase [Lacimicrobium alkaliphilum]GGD79118.1 oxidoreductase [Lacimicrobium alkaliphilum]